MGAGTKESIKMKVFPKGQVVIPVSLRKKYQIEIGDQIDVPIMIDMHSRR